MKVERTMIIYLTDDQMQALQDCGEDSDCDGCPCRIADDGCLACQVFSVEDAVKSYIERLVQSNAKRNTQESHF